MSRLACCLAVFLCLGSMPLAIQASPFPGTEPLSGEVVSEQRQEIIAPFSFSWNMRLDWLAPQGQAVAKGDVVVRFDTASLADRIQQLRSGLEVAELEYQRDAVRHRMAIRLAEVELAIRALEKERAETQAGVPAGLLSQARLDTLRLAALQAEMAWQNARDKLESVKAARAAAEEIFAIEQQQKQHNIDWWQHLIEQRTMRAGQKGFVLRALNRRTGKALQTGHNVQTSQPVASVLNPDKLAVTLWVPEFVWSEIQPGQTLSLRFDALPQVMLKGRIEKLSRRRQQSQVTGEGVFFQAAVSIEQNQPGIEKLVPGMSVQAWLGAPDTRLAGREPHGNGAWSAQPDTGDIAVDGEVVPLDSQVITPPLFENQWNTKLAWLAEHGSRVKAGDVVVRFGTEDLQKTLESKQGELQAARKAADQRQAEQTDKLARLRLQLEEVRSHLRKARRKAAIPESAQRRIDYQVNQYNLAIAEQKVRYEEKQLQFEKQAGDWQAKLDQLQQDRLETAIRRIRDDMRKAEVKADKSGIFLVGQSAEGSRLKVGDQVWPGLTVAEISPDSQVAVRLVIPERWSGVVSTGDAVKLSRPAVSGAMLDGVIVSRSVFIRPDSARRPRKVFDATVAIQDDKAATLQPGMVVEALITPRSMSGGGAAQ